MIWCCQNAILGVLFIVLRHVCFYLPFYLFEHGTET